MVKVLLVQPILSHYRESLFELMVKDFDIEFQIIAGKDLNGVQVFESKSNKIKANLKNYKLTLKGHHFYFQKGLYKTIKKYKPNQIILGGPDFHFISTILISLYLFLFTKIKVHYWTHGLSKSNSQVQHKLTNYFYSRATSIFTYEQDGKEELIAKMNLDKNKIIVVKNCLNDWDYGFNKGVLKNKSKSDVINILFSGRLTKAKRADILIKSIKLLVEHACLVNCIIIGDGKIKLELETLVDSLGLKECVKFKGALYEEHAEKYFKSSDVFVLPGKVGLSIIHALSYGLPVITTTSPIHSPEASILKQDHNAFFFNGDSPEELAKTIIKFHRKVKKNNNDLKNICVNSVLENGYTPISVKAKFMNGIGYKEFDLTK